MADLILGRGIGPDNSGVPQIEFRLPAQQTALDSGSIYGSFNLSRVASLALLPAGTVVITSAITGSSSGQTVNVSYTGDMTAEPAAYWLVNPGGATQEVVRATALPTSTTMTATFFQNHSSGEIMIKIYSVWTLFGRPLVFPGPNVIDPVFVRFSALPPGVYDHYVLAGSTGTIAYEVDDALPWVKNATLTPSITTDPAPVPLYDSGSVSATGKPTNGVVIYTGTISGSGGVYQQLRVQFLATVAPEPPIATEYRIWADI